MRSVLYSLAIVCSLHAIVAGGVDSVATVILKDVVDVEHEQLTLADMAQVRAADEWRERLEQFGLGSAPRPGLSRRFDRETLTRLIRERHGQSVALIWDGAERVTVRRPGVEYPPETFVQPARERLLEHLRVRHPEISRIEATPIGTAKLTLPSGPLSLSVRTIRGERLAKRMCVWIDASVNGAPAGSLPLWFAVSAYRPAAVAALDVPRHDVLEAGNVRVEEHDVAGLASDPLTLDFASDKLRARYPLSPGRVILASDVEPKPSVHRHQEIQVQVRSGGVTIETSGIAMEEGQVGDRVSVRNPDSRKTYRAQVVAEGVVMVAAQ